jgi:DNA-binding NarL/FixJ family response regulator
LKTLDFSATGDHAVPMKIFITDQQKAELERLHDSSRDKRVCDRIKAILLASEGWSSAMIAQALRLHQTTVDHHIGEFLNKGKLKPKMAAQTANSALNKRLF